MNAKRIGKQQDGLSIPGNSQQQHQHPGEGEEPIDTELEELRRVRRALSKMNQGIENVQHQMKYFNSNVSQTTQLLDIWVRILSQTAHNKAYLANEDWHGGSMDTAKLSDLAQRDRQREEEAERRAMESEERHEREREEARERERERRRAEAVEAETAARQQTQVTRPGIVPGRRPPPGPGARGRGAGTRGGRGRGRGSSSSISSSSRSGSIPPATSSSRMWPPR